MPKKDNPLDKPHPGSSADEFPELNEFCELLVKNSPHGIIVADESATIVFANDAYCRLTGRSGEGCAGAHPPYSDWTPGEARMVEEYVRRLSGGESDPWETTLASKNGESFPVIVSGKEIRTKRDTVYYSAMIRDITEQKRIEAQIREGEEQFRRIAQTSPAPIYPIDVNVVMTYVSPAIEEILMLLSSRAFKNPTWASPRAPPPARTRATPGGEVLGGDFAIEEGAVRVNRRNMDKAILSMKPPVPLIMLIVLLPIFCVIATFRPEFTAHLE